MNTECPWKQSKRSHRSNSRARSARREGLALLQQTRAAAADKGRKLLREAEERAAEKAAEIDRAAEIDCAALQEAAGKHLDEAAEFIVGRVVNH